MISFTPRPPYPQGKNPCYPLDRRLGGLQSRSRRGGEEKNSQPLPGLEPPIISAMPLRYAGSYEFIYEVPHKIRKVCRWKLGRIYSLRNHRGSSLHQCHSDISTFQHVTKTVGAKRLRLVLVYRTIWQFYVPTQNVELLPLPLRRNSPCSPLRYVMKLIRADRLA
jgi:hypothetical protein